MRGRGEPAKLLTECFSRANIHVIRLSSWMSGVNLNNQRLFFSPYGHLFLLQSLMTKLSLTESNLITGRQHRWWLQERSVGLQEAELWILRDNFICALVLKSLFKFTAIKLASWQTSPVIERNQLRREHNRSWIYLHRSAKANGIVLSIMSIKLLQLLPLRLRARLKTMFVVMTAKTKGSLV